MIWIDETKNQTYRRNKEIRTDMDRYGLTWTDRINESDM